MIQNIHNVALFSVFTCLRVLSLITAVHCLVRQWRHDSCISEPLFRGKLCIRCVTAKKLLRICDRNISGLCDCVLCLFFFCLTLKFPCYDCKQVMEGDQILREKKNQVLSVLLNKELWELLCIGGYFCNEEHSKKKMALWWAVIFCSNLFLKLPGR